MARLRKRAVVQAVAAKDAAAARRLSEPPATQGRGRLAWLAMLGCMLAAAPALVVEIQRPDVTNPHEAQALATAMDTWRHQAQLQDGAGTGLLPGVSFEMWVPHRNGEPRLDVPPGASALYTLAASTLGTPSTSSSDAAMSADALIWRARLTAATCGMVAVGAVFWAGYSLGGLASATIAALFCAAMPLFVFHGRMATEAMPHLMWSTLAVAAALWAMRPLRPAASFGRQAGGWLICGLAMGAALITGGSIAAPLLLLPLVVMILMCPHRLSHLMGLVAAVVVATLMALPWLAYVYDHNAQVWQMWMGELRPTMLIDPQLLGTSLGWRGVLVLLAVMPWTGWLIAGLMQPFSTSSAGSRAKLFLGWAWFLTVTMLMVVAPDTTRLGWMLVIVPAASVMMGQLFGQFVELSAEGRHARLWRGMRWAYLAGAAGVAVLVPTAFGLQSTLIERGWLTARFSAAMGWPYWVGLSIVLLAGVVLIFRWAGKHYPGMSAAAAAVWMIVLMTMLAIPLARGPLADSLMRQDAKILNALADDLPVYWLTDIDGRNCEPDPALLLHVQRRLPPISMRQIEQAMREHPRLYVLAPQSNMGLQQTALGGELIGHMLAIHRGVWRYTASSTTDLDLTRPPQPHESPH